MKQWYSSGSTYPWILNCSRLTSGFLEWCGLRMFHAWRCWPWDCGQGTDNSLALDLGECCRCSGHSCLRIEILKLNTWHRVVRVIQWYSLTTLSSWYVLIFVRNTYHTIYNDNVFDFTYKEDICESRQAILVILRKFGMKCTSKPSNHKVDSEKPPQLHFC